MSATTVLPDRPRAAEKKGLAPIDPRPEEARHFVTPEEYLARERPAEFKSEYVDGEMIAMPGVSLNHSIINGNLTVALYPHFKSHGCRLHSGDLRVWIPATDSYFYPDLTIVCGKPQLKDEIQDNLMNPLVVIEILSPSTEKFDRGRKFDRYKSIESLREYILVAQDRTCVWRYTRQADGTWTEAVFDGPEGELQFSSRPVKIPLREIYEDVDFGRNVLNSNAVEGD